MDITFKNKLQKAVAVAAGALLLLSSVGSAFVGTAFAFSASELPTWAQPYEQELRNAGVDVDALLSNYDSPSDSITRGDFVWLMSAQADWTDFAVDSTEQYYTDVPSSDPRYPHVQVATELGIVNGPRDPDTGELTGEFDVDGFLDRAAASKITVLANGLKPYNGSTDMPDVASLVGQASAPWYILEADGVTTPAPSAWVYGIYTGDDGTKMFRAPDPVNIAEALALAVRSSEAELLPGYVELADEVVEESDACDPAVDPDCEEPCEDDPDTEVNECDPAQSDATLEIVVNQEEQVANLVAIPKGATSVPFIALDITAMGDDAYISEIEVNRSGPGSANNFEEFAFYDAETLVKLSSDRSMRTDTNNAVFNTKISVASGETRTVLFLGDVSPTAPSNAQNVFLITDASKITHNAQSLTADFPLSGNMTQIAGASVNTATISVPSQVSDLKLGDKQVEVSILEVSMGSGGNDGNLLAFSLEQYGSADLDESLANVTVEINGDPHEADVTFDGRRMTVKFVDPPFIEGGDDPRIEVLADIVGGRVNVDSVQLAVDEGKDFLIRDASVGFNARVVNNADSSQVTEVVIEGSDLTFIQNNLEDLTYGDEDTVKLVDLTAIATEAIDVNEATVTVFVRGPGDNTPTYNAGVSESADAANGPMLVSGNVYDFDMDSANNTNIEVGDFVTYTVGGQVIYGLVTATDGTWTDYGLQIRMDESPVGLLDGTISEANILEFLTDVELRSLSEDGETVGGSLSDVQSNLTDCTYDAVVDGYPCSFDSTWSIEGSEDGEGHVQRFALMLDTEEEIVDGLNLWGEVSFDGANFLEYAFDGDEVEAANITGITTQGPVITIRTDGLTVAQGSDVNSDVTVDGADGVNALSAYVQANNGTVTVDEMRFRIGAATLATAFTGDGIGDLDTKQYVTNATLLREGEVVDSNMTLQLVQVNPAAGWQLGDWYYVESDVEQVIEEDEGVTYTLQLNLQNVLDDADPDYFVYATTIPGEDFIDVRNEEDNTVAASPSSAINPLTAGEPDTYLTVIPRGSVVVEAVDSPIASQVVAGTQDVVLARYEVQAIDEDFEFEEATVLNSSVDDQFNDGDEVDTNAIEEVKLRFTNEAGETETFSTTLAAGAASFTGMDFILPKDEVVQVEVLADLNTAASSDNTVSGQRVQLGFLDDPTTGQYEIRGVGSGTNVQAPTVSESQNIDAHEVVLGKLTFSDGPNFNGGMMQNGVENTLKTVNVVSEGQTSRLARMVFDVSPGGLNDAADDILDFRFFHNGSARTPSQVNIFAVGDAAAAVNVELASGAGLNAAGLGVGTETLADPYRVIVTSPQALALPAGSHTLSLRATVTGAPDNVGTADATLSTRVNVSDEDVNLAAGGGVCVNSAHNGLGNRCRIFDTTATGPGLFAALDDFSENYVAGRSFIVNDNSRFPVALPSWFTLTGTDVDDASGPNSFRNGFNQKLDELTASGLTYDN